MGGQVVMLDGGGMLLRNDFLLPLKRGHLFIKNNSLGMKRLYTSC